MKPIPERVKELRKFQNVKYILLVATSLFLATIFLFRPTANRRLHHRPLHAKQLLETCKALKVTPSSNFAPRTQSDRYVPGTNATWIRNATIWIGREEGTYESGDILLDKYVDAIHAGYPL